MKTETDNDSDDVRDKDTKTETTKETDKVIRDVQKRSKGKEDRNRAENRGRVIKAVSQRERTKERERGREARTHIRYIPQHTSCLPLGNGKQSG